LVGIGIVRANAEIGADATAEKAHADAPLQTKGSVVELGANVMGHVAYLWWVARGRVSS